MFAQAVEQVAGRRLFELATSLQTFGYQRVIRLALGKQLLIALLKVCELVIRQACLARPLCLLDGFLDFNQECGELRGPHLLIAFINEDRIA